MKGWEDQMKDIQICKFSRTLWRQMKRMPEGQDDQMNVILTINIVDVRPHTGDR